MVLTLSLSAGDHQKIHVLATLKEGECAHHPRKDDDVRSHLPEDSIMDVEAHRPLPGTEVEVALHTLVTVIGTNDPAVKVIVTITGKGPAATRPHDAVIDLALHAMTAEEETLTAHLGVAVLMEGVTAEDASGMTLAAMADMASWSCFDVDGQNSLVQICDSGLLATCNLTWRVFCTDA